MKDRSFLALVVIASLAIKIPIALFFLQGFGVDESLYLATARDYATTGVFGVDTEFNDFRFIAPLLAFVMSGFYTAFGDAGPLLVSPIVGSLAIIPFFYLGKLVVGQGGGRLMALLLFFNPAYFLLNTRPLTESIGLLLFSVSVLVFLLSIENKKYRFFVLPTLVMTFLARYPYGVLLAAFFVAVLIFGKKIRFLLNQNILAGVAIALVIAAPWLFYNLETYGDIFGGPLHQGGTDAGFDYQKASWYFPYLFMIAGATFPFMLYGFMKNVRERKLVYAIVGLVTIFLVQFFVFGKSVEERYILPALPFVLLLTVSGYEALVKRYKNTARYAFIALVVVNVLGAAYLTYTFSNLPRYSDADDAAVWVRDNCRSPIFGNLFTPIYNVAGFDVTTPTFDLERDAQTIADNKVNCVVVSAYESPYIDFFANETYLEKKSFGNVFVYKVS